MKCRAITTKNVLCKKTALQGKSYCSCHHKKIVEGIQKFTKISDKKEISFSVLPDDILQNIYLQFFKSQVLPEIEKYDQPGDFINTYDNLCYLSKSDYRWPCRYVSKGAEIDEWLDRMTKTYQYINRNDLWECFRRTYAVQYSYGRVYSYSKVFRNEKNCKLSKFLETFYRNVERVKFIKDMMVFEYIANHGWIKFIMS